MIYLAQGGYLLLILLIPLMFILADAPAQEEADRPFR